VNGPVTVTEEHRYARTKPTTAHQVEGQTLRLIQSGCGDDEIRCNVDTRDQAGHNRTPCRRYSPPTALP
jgi:hypothetical protein